MTSNQKLRLFIALAIPEVVKAELEQAQADLRRVLPGLGIRWTRREQFHLTLKFLGDVEATRVEALGEALRGVCQGYAPLRLRAEGVGGFPDLCYPRVIWTGVRDDTDHLPRLQAAVDVASREFISEEKRERFTGHVTLARIQSVKRAEAEALAHVAAGLKERLFGEWTAYKMELMRSELFPHGARHIPLAVITLGELPADLA